MLNEPDSGPAIGASAVGTTLDACPPAPWAERLPLEDVFVHEDYDRASWDGTRKLIRTDFQMARIYFGSSWTHLFPNVFVALTYRVGHFLHRKGLRRLAQVPSVICMTLTGAEVRPQAEIGPGFVVVHPVAVVIGSGVVTGRHLVLYGSNTIGWSVAADGSGRGGMDGGFPRLGNDVVMFTHSCILGPVQVGNGVLVAAHALVLDDVPDGAAPRGVPAKC